MFLCNSVHLSVQSHKPFLYLGVFRKSNLTTVKILPNPAYGVPWSLRAKSRIRYCDRFIECTLQLQDEMLSIKVINWSDRAHTLHIMMSITKYSSYRWPYLCWLVQVTCDCCWTPVPWCTHNLVCGTPSKDRNLSWICHGNTCIPVTNLYKINIYWCFKIVHECFHDQRSSSSYLSIITAYKLRPCIIQPPYHERKNLSSDLTCDGWTNCMDS